MTKLQATGALASLLLLATMMGLIIDQRKICNADDKSCNDSILSVCSISIAFAIVTLACSIAPCTINAGEVRSSSVGERSVNNVRQTATDEEWAHLTALSHNPDPEIRDSLSNLDELIGLITVDHISVDSVQDQNNQAPVDTGAGMGIRPAVFSARTLINTEDESTEDAIVLE